MIYDWNYDLIKQYVAESDSYSEVLRKLNIPIRGNNISTLKNKLDEYNIETNHFTHSNKSINTKVYKNVYLYLTLDSNISSYKLKQKLITEGLKENKCEQCGCSEWFGKKLNIQLHHIDGNIHNNELSNLIMLCPNCHSITENYAGASNKKIHNYCKDCGKEILKNSIYCSKCVNIHRRHVERPDKDVIWNDILAYKNFVKLGKKYGVTDNTIKKWLKYYGLPYKIKDIKYIINCNN